MRRLSFSARFAILLAVLGVLIAGVTAVVPFTQAATETQQAARERVADRVAVVLGLLRAEERSLGTFVSGAAAQTPQAPQAAQFLERVSAQTSSGDLVALITPGGIQVAVDGRTLSADSTRSDALRAAAASTEPVVGGADGVAWLVAHAPVDGQPATLVVGRPLAGSTMARLGSDAGGRADDGIALVRDDRYVVDGAIAGHAVAAAERPDIALETVLQQVGQVVVVHLGSDDVAAATSDLGSSYRLLVSTVVGAGGSASRGIAAPTAVIAAAMMLLALVVVFVIVQRDLQRPLRRLDRAVSAMARDDYDVPVPHDRDDEIGRLGASFDSMRRDVRAVVGVAQARAAIATDLSTITPLGPAIDAVCERLRATTGAASALVVLGDPEAEGPEVHSAGSLQPVGAAALLSGDGPIAAAARIEGAEPLVACALEGTPEAEAGMRVICAAPLRLGTRSFGALAIADCGEGFSMPDIALVASAAEQTSVALERQRVLTLAQLQASTDGLTGLYNRRFLMGYLDRQLLLADRSQRALSVLMLDLDHFKALNDTHGHEAGDHALRAVAGALTGCLRRSDLAARYGGEEFVVVMSDTDADDALLVAEKVRDAVGSLRLEVPTMREAARLTVSVGVATRGALGTDAAKLLASADSALYVAKGSGRDRVAVAADGDDNGSADDATPAQT